MSADTIILTMGVSTDDPVSNYGFSFYDEGVTGYPGAPFGEVNPAALRTHNIIYLAFGPTGDGFVIYVYLSTPEGAAPPADVFETMTFMDDADVEWTFAADEADFPNGSDFSFGTIDVRGWQWTVPASALPTVTEGNDYDIVFDAEPPVDSSSSGDNSSSDSSSSGSSGSSTGHPPGTVLFARARDESQIFKVLRE